MPGQEVGREEHLGTVQEMRGEGTSVFFDSCVPFPSKHLLFHFCDH